ncbi:MAG: glutaminyl-peptide cyclotransferase [Bacteroidales bacterium]|nr:glutaminyl-peptide cyclotransferase [Bacteroidales bacterium]
MKALQIATILAAFSLNACSQEVRDYTIDVLEEYPHATDAYTQGLFFNDGRLYESTGQYGESSFRELDLQTGKILNSFKISNEYFAEGSVMLNGKLYMLTWESRVAFIYDAQTLKYEKAVRFPRQGWGLTTDGSQLIASDGSSLLYFLDPDLKLKKRLNVTLDGQPVRYLNELEWIDGRIWANVYTTDYILIINPKDGKVEGRIDCTGLLPDELRTPDTDVLNGIAIDATGNIYLTGKNWPKMYRIALKPAR